MIDIHCHILPNVDDGASSVNDSLLMAKQAVKQGITSIIATPHHMNNRDVNIWPEVLEKVQKLNRLFEEENVDLTIISGQEVRIYGEIFDDIVKGYVRGLGNSNYILIEFPSNHVPRYTDRLFFDLQLKGYIPVIAHPERNQELLERPEVLYNLVSNGALSQVTAASVTGNFGKKIKKFSLQLIESNLTHFLASGAHNTTTRGSLMGEAYHTIQSEYGMDIVYLFKENADLLIEGRQVIREVPEMIKQKKFLGLF